jgi:hypothetical protein
MRCFQTFQAHQCIVFVRKIQEYFSFALYAECLRIEQLKMTARYAREFG